MSFWEVRCLILPSITCHLSVKHITGKAHCRFPQRALMHVLVRLEQVLRLNTSGLTFKATQVVEAATTNLTFSHEFNALDEG